MEEGGTEASGGRFARVTPEKRTKDENEDEHDWDMALNTYQGLPWVSGNKRFALQGLEAYAIRSRGSEPIPGRTCWPLQGQFGWGKLPRVNPGLSYFGHFGPRIGRPSALRKGAKHVQARSAWVALRRGPSRVSV
jgi:hypothetical protein